MLRLPLLGMIAMLASTPVHAQSFYAGKTVTIVTSTGPGGSYDLVARLVAKYMPQYLPGTPTMIVRNMPGGGHVVASNYMATVAPKDGTTIATVDNIVPLHQVLDERGVRYDAARFGWLGSTGPENSVAFVWHTTGVRTIADATRKDVILGATGAGSSTIIYAMVMNNLLGTRFKIVTGYKSSNEVFLAMERGELEASTGSYVDLVTKFPSWLAEHKISLVAQMGLAREKDISDVPLLTELAQTGEQRRIMTLVSSPLALGLPYLAPPGLPPERLALLRQAFAATLEDKGFRAETAALHFEIEPMNGDDVARIVDDTLRTPPGIVAKAKAAMGEGKAAP